MRPVNRPESLPPISTRGEAHAKGQTFFYTGRPCRAGHLAVRYVSTGGCTMCLDSYKTENAKNPFDHRLVPFDGSGIWRAGHWDAPTLQRAKEAVQVFLNEWTAANAPLPVEPELKLRNVYGTRYTIAGTTTSELTQQTYELWAPWREHTRRQLAVRASGAINAPTVELFTREALESKAPWVYVDLLNGDGPRWYVCEHIDFALYKVIEDHALHVAVGMFGLDGSLGVTVS